MSNESNKPKSNAILGVAYPKTPSPAQTTRPQIGHIEEHGIQPVAYVTPPVKPPTGDGGAEMVSE